MNIAVIGAGIVGVTTAWELARDGHQVTVFERRLATAEEGSFANAGLVAPATIGPWPAPGMPFNILRHLLSRHAPVRFSWPLTVGDLGWMWQSWRACAPQTHLRNRQNMLRLGRYSQARLHELADELEFEFDHSSGVLMLLRSERELSQLRPAIELLRQEGVVLTELDPAQARTIEPALNPDTNFHAALNLPGDEAANCRQFALLLKNQALKEGIRFEFNADIEAITTPARGGIELRARGAAQGQHFDAAVLCTGTESVRLLRPLGIRLPVAPVFGYSVSATVREPLNAPRSAVVDARYKVAVSRLGQRVRVAGGAELGGRIDRTNRAAVQTLYKVLHDWFPGAAVLSSGIQTWKGARAMLPDGPPLLGASGVPGVWLNIGHGSAGWTMACGSARVLADQLAGRPPELDTSGFGLQRLAGYVQSR